MKDFNFGKNFGVVALDDAFDCYEISKRTISDTPLFYFDLETNKFKKIKSSIPWWIESPAIYDFERFEFTRVEKELKKWCKSNGLEYKDQEYHE